MTKITVSDLHPNPFRDLARLPTKAAKIEALKQSIKTTDFWDNLVARKRPNGAGGYEIAYGHNRLAALRQLKIAEIDIPVRQLSDDIMLKMMANENMEEWGATADVEQETVRAVVKAFATGKIALPKADSKRNSVRTAPSFAVSSKSNRLDLQYTADTVASFLGWKVWRVDTALGALALIEDDVVRDDDFTGLTPTQTAALVRETKRVAKETKDQKLTTSISRKLASGMRSATGRTPGRGGKTADERHEVTARTARVRADELMREARVDIRITQRKKRKEAFDLQKQDRQVKVFLDACKTFDEAMTAAAKAISKFSPEAKAFTVRRLDKVANAISVLRGRLA